MKYRFPEEFIDRVRESSDLVEVASEYLTLTRNGDRYKGLCPFHREDTPSFFISADKQLYHCFGCGEGGNVFNFIMGVEKLDFIDAVKFLADRAGIAIPRAYEGSQDDGRYKFIQKIYSANLEAARFYAGSLRSSKRAMDYLLKRGLTTETVRHFGLGYAVNEWDRLLNYLKKKGFSDDIIAGSGLFIKRKDGSGFYDRFRNRIIFPIIDVRGRVVGFGGRVLDSADGPKYMNSPETPVFIKRNSLYGLNTARKHIHGEEIIVVEGYMDVISLHQRGIKNVVASLGTAFTRQQAEMLKRYCRNIVIAYDADAAGQTATLRGLEILQAAGCNVKVVEIPEGKDPDDYVSMYGGQAFEQVVKNGYTFMDYRIKLLREKYDLDDRQQKLQFLKEVSGLVAGLDSEIEISEYIKVISHSTGIYESALREEIFRIKKGNAGYKRNIYGKNRHNNSVEQVKHTIKDAVGEAEENILALMLKNIRSYTDLGGRVAREDFSDRFHRKLMEAINLLSNKGRLNVADLLNLFDDREEINRIVSLAEKDISVDVDDMDKFVEDCIYTIHMHRDRQRANYIKQQISELSGKTDRTGEEDQLYRKLCTEFVNIQRKMRGLSGAMQKGGDTDED